MIKTTPACLSERERGRQLAYYSSPISCRMCLMTSLQHLTSCHQAATKRTSFDKTPPRTAPKHLLCALVPRQLRGSRSSAIDISADQPDILSLSVVELVSQYNSTNTAPRQSQSRTSGRLGSVHSRQSIGGGLSMLAVATGPWKHASTVDWRPDGRYIQHLSTRLFWETPFLLDSARTCYISSTISQGAQQYLI